MKRRSVLAGAVAAPLALGFGISVGGLSKAELPALTLYDAKLARARFAARDIELRGGATRDTGGEIAALLLREQLLAKGGAVLGLTGHSEFLLASDIARMAGRQVSPLMQAGRSARWLGGEGQQPWFSLLAGTLGDRTHPRSHATVFAWIAA